MNKHPESGSASEATNKQGFENLTILRTLERLEYLTLEVQTPPQDIEIDLSNGDVADMKVLAYAEEHDSRLVSGDQSLVDVARLSETPTVDIKHLDSLASSAEDDSGLDEVLSEIGATLHTKKEILGALTEVLDQSSTIPEAETTSHSRSDPEGILGRRESNGEILPYIRADSGELCYAPCEEVTFVPTKPALEHLSSYLDEADKYLTDDLLTQITAGLHSIHDSKIPAITLLVPSEYVIEMSVSESAPSEFNQGLVKLASAKNVEYNSTPAIQHDMNIQSLAPQSGAKSSDSEGLLSWRDYLAVCCTKNHESAKLLVTNTEDGLWKFSKLLGIDAVSIDPKGGEEGENS